MGVVVVSMAIAIAVAPAQLRLDAAAPPTATVTVTASRAPRLWCSTGTLTPLEARGGDRFVARWTAPAETRPTVAMMAAIDDDAGEAATAEVQLGARSEIPVDTEPGAQVVVTMHGRRTTAHANAAGKARVLAWVWPGERTATVTALDAAGNATTHEVTLELARAPRVFLLAPAAAAPDAPVRIWAFAVGGATPAVDGGGATLATVSERPSVATLVLSARADVTVSASAGDERVSRAIRIGAAATAESRLSRWELGVAVVGTDSSAFTGAGAIVEARRRLGRWMAIGLDLDGRWATGTLGNENAAGGGLALRVPVEARFAVARPLTLFVALAVGGHWARLRGASVTFDDGGPIVGGSAGMLAWVGPGWLEVALGYFWTPLVGHGRADVEGGAITVGYRVARWHRRRGGGRRRAPRRRRARRR